MIHPYRIDRGVETITVKFKGATLNGKPHGLCKLTYSGNVVNDRHNFKGTGVMMEGKLHGGPASFVQGDGWR